jgi:arylsulfatase A-like enzyme
MRVLVPALSLAFGLASAPGASADADRPSILLFVLDTTRVDAVSAYGAARATTPSFDRLAAEGLLYRQAYSNAPWTLPSHATLFTGQLPREHGIGVRSWRAAEGLPTLASRLHDAGYDTAGFSENPFVGELTNLDQGFATFEQVKTVHAARPRADGGLSGTGERLTSAVREWLGRERTRPFFLFVNVVDPHFPYEVRLENPFLPAGVDRARAGKVVQVGVPAPLCHKPIATADIDILYGLYLGDVAAGDRKLAAVHEAARRAAGTRRLVTIATSDHGESFGEQGLMGHLFGMGNQLLHVPLVVHGLPGAEPRALHTPVQLADVAPSVLAWSGVTTSPAEQARRLPVQDGGAGSLPLLAQYGDLETMGGEQDAPLVRFVADQARKLRQGCKPQDRLFGGIEAAIAFPWKALAYEGRAAELYDLHADPAELFDLARVRPQEAARLTKLLRRGEPVRRAP